MREQIQARLVALKHEFDSGQSQLQELERQQTRLRETLLRISGAIQVLDELLTMPSQDQSRQPAENGSIVNQAS